MQIQRTSSRPDPGVRATPPAPPGAAGPAEPADEFQISPTGPSVAKKIFGVTSVAGTAGMMAGASLGSKFGHPAVGFAAGLVLGGAAGFALARFAYAAEP